MDGPGLETGRLSVTTWTDTTFVLLALVSCCFSPVCRLLLFVVEVGPLNFKSETKMVKNMALFIKMILSLFSKALSALKNKTLNSSNSASIGSLKVNR